MFRRTTFGGTLCLAAGVSLLLSSCSSGSAKTAAQSSSQGTSASSATSSDSSGSSAPAATHDPITLTYFTFSAAPDHLKDLDTIVKGFEAENPGITIKVETAPYTDYFTKLQTDVAGGTVADTFEVNYENSVSYAASGALLDLTAPSKAESEVRPVGVRRCVAASVLEGRRAVRPARGFL